MPVVSVRTGMTGILWVILVTPFTFYKDYFDSVFVAAVSGDYNLITDAIRREAVSAASVCSTRCFFVKAKSIWWGCDISCAHHSGI